MTESNIPHTQKTPKPNDARSSASSQSTLDDGANVRFESTVIDGIKVIQIIDEEKDG